MKNTDLNKTKLKDFIKKIIDEQQIPGLSISVVKDNKQVFGEGFGYSRLNKKIKMNTDTIISVGSISKSITSTAVMKLVDEGFLSIEDPINKYLEDFSHKIKIKYLLNHTSGLPGKNENYGNINILGFKNLEKHPELLAIKNNLKYNRKSLKDFEDITKHYSNLKLSEKNGMRFSYNNDGYIILADIIEKITHEKFDDYIQENIFKELDMRNSFARYEEVENNHLRSNYYSVDNFSMEMFERHNSGLLDKYDSFSICTKPFPKNNIAAPAGFVFSTVEDLSNYMIANMSNNRKKLLSKESLYLMQKKYIKVNQNESYGLGWYIDNYRGSKRIGHRGFFPGLSTQLFIIPKKQLGVVVLTNFVSFRSTLEISNKALELYC